MLTTAYNPFLVGLSVLIATIASYVALDMAVRVTVATGTARRHWILASAAAMGIGIWSMHFVGMLALIVDVPVAYNIPLLALSILVAIAGSAVTFFVSARERLRFRDLAVASFFMGPAIAGMHYIGMAAMRMPARISYDRGLLALSVAIAIAVSYVALQLAVSLRHNQTPRGNWLRLGAGAVMGAAVYGMHYTGMLAAKFDHGSVSAASMRWSILGDNSLVAAVTVTTFMMLAIAAVGVIADRRLHAVTAEATRRTMDLLRAMIEDSPEAIIATDLDLRVTRWNAAATTLLGWESREIVGDDFAKVLAERGVRGDEALRRAALRGGESRTAAALYRRKNGSMADVSVSVGVLHDERGEPSGFVYLVTDEVKRKRLQERVHQSQKMEAVGQLAGGVAHDFNNLLTAIVNYTGFLLAALPEGDPRRADVLGIEKAADRAAALTRQLLAFSRQEMIRETDLAINDVIASMHPMLVRLLPANIRISTSLTEDVGLVRADSGQVEQVLLNLVLNASDAMPGGGTLTIETAIVPPGAPNGIDDGAAGNGEGVMLSVADTGTGMTPEVQARVFEPFFTTKPVGSGTGLGLATVHGIVTQSNGRIAIESEVGVGTRIAVTLPRVAAKAGGRDEAIEARSPAGSETILLVEDDEMVRAVTTRTLRAKGYTVLEAADGHEAIATYRAHRRTVDLVITDMVMPGMGGYEVESFLREVDPTLRLLFISGYSRDALDRRGSPVAAHDFLSKPFAAESLLQKVREMLDR
jgi:PAS domain S-box-containing protein